jgi:hypothetical protein
MVQSSYQRLDGDEDWVIVNDENILTRILAQQQLH